MIWYVIGSYIAIASLVGGMFWSIKYNLYCDVRPTFGRSPPPDLLFWKAFWFGTAWPIMIFACLGILITKIKMSTLPK